MKNAEVLNDLVEINNDRIEGYEKAASQAKDPDLTSLFTEMANQSKELVSELRELVRAEGEEPAKGTTARGKIYRAWMDVKKPFGGGDRKSILASCEFGEDAAQRAYESALKEDDITSSVRQVLEKEKSTLRASHDRIRDMRDAASS
ncbi:MAG TPA: PA2169 family four-helix-bundle protein [Chitinophagaceae bacterium]